MAKMLPVWACFFLLLAAAFVPAARLPLKNGSFESPETVFATPAIDDWTTDGPVIDPDFGVNLDAGVFLNRPQGDPEHVNCVDGDQLAFLGTNAGNEIVQIISDTIFESSLQYTISADVAHSTTRIPQPDDILRIGLFYEDLPGDPNARRILVTSVDIVNDPNTGLSSTVVKNFTASTAGPLGADHPAVGKPVGVLLTTIGQLGGFFDIDNVVVDAGCPYVLLGDVNDDCIHNIVDFALYSRTWMADCFTDPNSPDCQSPGP